jgi:hypothetical protein
LRYAKVLTALLTGSCLVAGSIHAISRADDRLVIQAPPVAGCAYSK